MRDETTTPIDRLRRDLTKWREDEGAPRPIPADLWSRAAALAAEHGVAMVAKECRLDYAALKKRVNARGEVSIAPSRPAAEPCRAEFVELLPPMSGLVVECSLEVKSARGARLRAQLKGMPPAGLACILREFAAS